jgi:hypothetical protein
MKPCHYCGQPVKVSSYRCPHCDRSLAAAEQQQWEQSDPSTESSEESYEGREPGSGVRISPAFVVICLLVGAAVIYGIFLRQRDKNDELPTVFTRPVRKPVASAAKKDKSEKTSFIRIHESSDSSVKDISASGTDAGESIKVTEENKQEEKIQLVRTQILEELRLESAKKQHTVRLTSGREIECKVVGESETHVTIKFGVLTATLERKSIENIEHQSQQAAEKKMEAIALARATHIVDQGLVRHGEEWITPAEEARRAHRSSVRERAEVAKATKPTMPATQAAKPDSTVRREKTDKEKLESLLALVREKGAVDADFFGGTLHIEDRSGQWPGDDDDPSSIIAFEAQAEQIDVAQLSHFLRLDFHPTGLCEAEIDGGVDKRDSKTLAGEAEVTCEDMIIPPIDLSALLSPLNKQAALSLGLMADDGIITIEQLRLTGTAYNIVGSGIVQLADEPGQSPINGTFKINLKEAPTLTDTKTAGKGMQYILDTLAGSGKEINVTLSGPISDPEVELVADSAIGTISFQIGK